MTILLSALTRRLISTGSIGDGAQTARGNLRRVFCQHAASVARRRRPPRRATPTDLGVGHVQLEQLLLRVDRYRVAFLHERDKSADLRLGGNVTDYQPVGAAGKASVGDQSYRIAKA